MKKVIKLICIILPLLIFVVGVNVYVDPANTYRTIPVSNKIISAFRSDQNMIISENYSDRTLIKKIILETDLSAPTIVMGSSRGAQISSDILGSESLNTSVTAAALEDIAAIWQMYLDSGKADDLENVVLSIDPWIFNENNNEARYQSYYYSYAKQFFRSCGLDLNTKNYLRYLGLGTNCISVAYFQASVKALPGRIAQDPIELFVPTDMPQAMGSPVLRSDNSYVYPMNYEYAEPTAVYDRVSLALRGIVDTFEEAKHPSERNTVVFENLILSIQSKGINVYFVISPYNPYVWDAMAADPKRYSFIFEVEDYLKDFAGNNGIPVAGSYDPGACGFSYGEFMDALHINSAATAILIDGLLKR